MRIEVNDLVDLTKEDFTIAKDLVFWLEGLQSREQSVRGWNY